MGVVQTMWQFLADLVLRFSGSRSYTRLVHYNERRFVWRIKEISFFFLSLLFLFLTCHNPDDVASVYYRLCKIIPRECCRERPGAEFVYRSNDTLVSLAICNRGRCEFARDADPIRYRWRRDPGKANVRDTRQGRRCFQRPVPVSEIVFTTSDRTESTWSRADYCNVTSKRISNRHCTFYLPSRLIIANSLTMGFIRSLTTSIIGQNVL